MQRNKRSATFKKASQAKRAKSVVRRNAPYQKKSLTAKVNALLESQEWKWYDTSIASATGGQVSPLNNIPQGDDSVTRDGRKIIMKSVAFKLAGNAAAGAGSFVAPRLAIVYDKNPNGVLPVSTDIFTTNDGTTHSNLNNRDRFVIMYDNFCGMKRGHDPLSWPGEGYVNFHIQEYLKLDLSTVYGPTGSGTIAGTQTGALYAVFLGSSTPSVIGSSFRVRFVDS